MSMQNVVRQTHRWVSVVFTLAVIANLAMMGREGAPQWVGFVALVPLIFLLLSGLYLFALPYLAKRR